LWYEASRGANGSQGGLAALASVHCSGCLCFTAVDVEYTADTALAQPAAGHPVCRRLGNHASTAHRLVTAQLKSLATPGVNPMSKDDFLIIKEKVMQFLFIY